MSKKNSLKKRRSVHEADLQLERQAKEELAKKREKKAKKTEREERKGVVKPKHKKKAIKLRKGIKIRGIKVVDSESRKKVRHVLAAEAALRRMEVEDGPGSSAAKAKAKGSTGLKGKVGKVRSKAAAKRLAARAAPAAMET